MREKVASSKGCGEHSRNEALEGSEKIRVSGGGYELSRHPILAPRLCQLPSKHWCCCDAVFDASVVDRVGGSRAGMRLLNCHADSDISRARIAGAHWQDINRATKARYETGSYFSHKALT